MENMEIKQGILRQRNLTDYIIPTACDCAPTTVEWVENPFSFGPLGAKGAGELTLIGAAPAVATAIENAIGRRIRKIPATPESLLELMEYGKR
jgi:CO/xanthine dehydrogenase Mo-binding subunit